MGYITSYYHNCASDKEYHTTMSNIVLTRFIHKPWSGGNMNDFFSKYSRAIIILETLLIAVLSLLLIREVNKPVPLVRDQRNLITHLD